MKVPSLLLLLFLFCCLTSAAAPKRKLRKADITYQLRFMPDSAALHVAFAYKTDAKGKLVLRYENNSWGDKNLFRCLKNLSVSPQPNSITFLPDSNQVVVTARPDQMLQVRYQVQQDFKEPLKNFHRYRPIIQPEYFHLLGMRLFMTPAPLFASASDSATVAFSWAAPRQGHLLHSSFGPELYQQATVTQDMLQSTFFAGGDFRRYGYDFKGQKVYLVTRGQWQPIQDQQVLAILKATIPAHMAFWKDKLQAPFSVSLLPTFEEWTDSSKSYSLGGSGLTNSFISFASNNPGTDLRKMRWLYNHELFHRWLGTTIVNEQEEKQYWFSEGFTDYYAYKLMLKHKQLTLEEYLETINKEVMPHYRSSVRSLANADFTQEKYWSEQRYQKLPYRRGFLYAFLLDNQIKQKYSGKKSLDHLMHDLLAKARTESNFKFNHQVFQQLLTQYLGTQAVQAFTTHILQGTPIDFQQELPTGLQLTQQKDLPALSLAPTADPKKLEAFLTK